MQERRRNPRGATTEQMASAEKDVAEVRPILHYSHCTSILTSQVIDLNLFVSSQMRKLQTRLLEKRRLWGHDPEMSSYAEDTWQSFLEK